MRPKKTWVYSPPNRAKPKTTEHLKQRLQAEADRLIEEFKPQFIEHPEEGQEFNYISDLYSKWHQSYLYLCATYSCPSPRALSPTFEQPFTRLEYAGNNRFHLAFMRHTGKWCEVFSDLSLEDAIASIRDDPMFHPG